MTPSSGANAANRRSRQDATVTLLARQRAIEVKVDPLGFCLPPFAYAIGQMLEQAIAAMRSLQDRAIADYLRSNEMKTLVRPIRFG